MPQEEKDRVINTDRKVEEQSYKRSPAERDESPDGQDTEPRGVMKQAAKDLEQGLVDTEARGTPGISQAVNPDPEAGGQAVPQPDRNRDMRDHDSTIPDGGKNR
jgi:hypothetical protein